MEKLNYEFSKITISNNSELTKSINIDKPYILFDKSNCSKDEMTKAFEDISLSTYICLDCEGIDLTRIGKLTLLQIRTDNNKVYLFDILELSKEHWVNGLKSVLESEKILKIGFDLRNDVDALLYQYQISPKYLLDMQLVKYYFRENIGKLLENVGEENKENMISNQLVHQKNNTKLAAWYLSNCQSFETRGSLFVSGLKDKNKRLNFEYDPKIFQQRPMKQENIDYGVNDVLLIQELYKNFEKQLTADSNKLLKMMIEASYKYAYGYALIKNRKYNKKECNGIINLSALMIGKDEVCCRECNYMVNLCFIHKNSVCLKCYLFSVNKKY